MQYYVANVPFGDEYNALEVLVALLHKVMPMPAILVYSTIILPVIKISQGFSSNVQSY